jgi:hypothetical protein
LIILPIDDPELYEYNRKNGRQDKGEGGKSGFRENEEARNSNPRVRIDVRLPPLVYFLINSINSTNSINSNNSTDRSTAALINAMPYALCAMREVI